MRVATAESIRQAGDVVVHLLIVAALALTSATCYGASYVIEQRKASEAPEDASLRIALLWHLAKQPMWWLGVFVDISGFGFQVWALGLGEVVFVQPLLVTSLPISLVIGHWAGSHHLKRRDLVWSFVFVVALACFLAAGNPTSGVPGRALSAWLIPLAVIGSLVLACVTISNDARPARRALMLGAAAGMLFGVSSTLMKTLSDLIENEGFGLVDHWEPYVLLGVVSLGFLIMQSAFQAGDLRAALPAIELGEPVVAVVLGLALFHEHLQMPNAFMHVLVIGSVAVMVVATIRLARSAAGEEPGPQVVSATVS